jgi:hypothetical protein
MDGDRRKTKRTMRTKGKRMEATETTTTKMRRTKKKTNC